MPSREESSLASLVADPGKQECGKVDIVVRLGVRAGNADFAQFMDDGVEKRRIQANRQLDLDAIAEIQHLREKAALFDYLAEYCSYNYGGDSCSEPSPPEFGIAWQWQATSPERPGMMAQLRREAFDKFDLYVNEMDPDDTPTEFDLLIMGHRDALSTCPAPAGQGLPARAASHPSLASVASVMLGALRFASKVLEDFSHSRHVGAGRLLTVCAQIDAAISLARSAGISPEKEGE